ncbi:MAG: hypothetical protein ACYTAS_10690 [Planctomycetota bacterium]|jgi:hypothetical protein
MRIQRRIERLEAALGVESRERGPVVVMLVSPEGTGPDIREPVEEWLTYQREYAKERPPGAVTQVITLDSQSEHEARQRKR